PPLSSHHLPSLSSFFTIPIPPTPTLFPYTTLFRSLPQLERTHPACGSRTSCSQLLFVLSYSTTAIASISTLASRGKRAKVEIERSEEHTSELQSPDHLVCRLLLEKKKQ